MQALSRSRAPLKLQLGAQVTDGLGAGGDPEVGARAAEESRGEMKEALEGADMVFITAGMGGGTGSGGAPTVAEVSREAGALTVAVVTRPFGFERGRRQSIAEEGLDNLRTKVDTLITVPNDRLLGVVQKKVTLLEAFRLADEVLREGVQGISDLITVPGLINLDFADVKAVMQDAGTAYGNGGDAGGGRGAGGDLESTAGDFDRWSDADSVQCDGWQRPVTVRGRGGGAGNPGGLGFAGHECAVRGGDRGAAGGGGADHGAGYRVRSAPRGATRARGGEHSAGGASARDGPRSADVSAQPVVGLVQTRI